VEPIWLQQDVVIASHDESIAEHGGSHGIRDLGLLESALARPRNLAAYAPVEPTLQRLAAAYAFGIASNHPFVDGNKRAAFIASVTFLRLNGLRLIAGTGDGYLIFIRLAEGSIDEEALAEWFTHHTLPA